MVLLVVFAAICLFQVIQTTRVFSMEGEMKASDEDTTVVLKLRDDKDFMDSYRSAQKYSLALGLDLQGGMFATLEVAVDDLIRQEAGGSVDAKFEKALKEAIIQKESSQSSLVELFYEALKKDDPGVKLSAYFANPVKQISFTSTNEEILEKLTTVSEEAIQNTYGIIRRRIDQFGVASPNIQLQAGRGRIILELPGVREPARVRELLRSTAKLEFWETYPYGEGFTELLKANEIVKRLKGLPTEADSAKTDTAITAGETPAVSPVENQVSVGDTDSLGMAIANTDTSVQDCESLAKIPDSLLTQNQQRAKFLCTYPILEEFSTQSQEQLNGYPNTPVLGYMNIRDTAKMNHWLHHPDVVAELPSEIKFAWGAKTEKDASDFLPLIALKVTTEGVPKLDGSHIERANQSYSSVNQSEATVSITMSVEGAKIWSDMTGANVGKSVAITMDNMVYSYPRVMNQIQNGNTEISGDFEIEEAKDLATLLSSGKLPVQVRIEGEKVIGPTLGAENITKGTFSFLIAFLLVIAFMAVYYNSAGLVADVALIINLFFIIGVSAAFNVVLTLPGIAAIVLTMGMAVDANVLVFERVREELGIGKSLRAAHQAGYKNAFSSIMDSNITTFLSGLILYAFGIGPIRGFAVSLMIGIATTLICALFITRMIQEFMLDRNPNGIKFWSKWSKHVFDGIHIKMTERKKYFYMFSVAVSIIGLISIFTVGFRQGVEFSGGYQYTVNYSGELDLDKTRNELEKDFGGTSPVIKTVGNGGQIMVTTNYKLNDQAALVGNQDALKAGLIAVNPNSAPEVIESIKVGAVVSSDIRRSAILAVIFTIFVIFIYILVRFRKWSYSVGAVVALAHDVLITMGVFSFMGAIDILPFPLELDQNFIAALLTIVGFSINDTVIVFDRVRENFGEMKSATLDKIFNNSMDVTLSRTMITSGTVLFTIVAMLFFGGSTIQPFMFALFVGIAFGTYSSVFVASGIAYDLMKREKEFAGNAVQAAKV